MLSLVIPVFNEEATIRKCLERVSAQRLPFDECIVVDNGCADRTMTIVSEFADRLSLTVVYEDRPGVGWARAAGFNAAGGDILCRIDADTRLDPEWSQRVAEYLARYRDVAAITGYSYVYGTPMDDRMRRGGVKAAAKGLEGKGTPVGAISGCNMAIRQSAWREAVPYLVNAPKTHEDLDLSHAVAKTGGAMMFYSAALAAISARRYAEPILDNMRYLAANIRTSRVHGDAGAVRRGLVRAPLNVAFILVMRAIVGPYDPEVGVWRPFRRKRRKRRVSPIVITEDRFE